MNARTVLVTGATNGIGKITALELARQGARVLIVGRDPQKGQAALAEIKAESGNEAVELMLADLSLMSETRRLASEIKSKVGALDVLVNNAGAIFTERRVTKENLEMTFALNHMSYFLLTTLLLPNLEAAPAGRVVNVSSEAHRFGRLNFDDLQSQRYAGMNAYGTSKLMNIMFTGELARRLEGGNVTANSLHPGVVATGFAQGSKGFWGFLFKLMRFIPSAMISPEQGAETSLYLASSDEVKGVTGTYFNNKRPAVPSPVSQDVAAQRRLWQESERIAGV
jgi:NAD(P)-dependent dehydrogenase (short-subunit alcohol dehydrogenase family)